MEDKSKQQDTIGDYALRLAGKGYNVLPLCWPTKDGKCACGRQHDTKNVGKAPLSTKGVKNATTDENKIRGWWKRWPEANVGIALAPSNLVMVDPDSPEALAEVEDLGLQPTLTRESHNTAFLYRVPEGTPTIRTTRQGDSGKLDILSDGHCVVYGTHYTGCLVHLEDPDMEPANAPPWVLKMTADYAEKKDAEERTSEARKQARQDAQEPPVVLKGNALKVWEGNRVVDKADGKVRAKSKSSEVDTSETLFQIGLALAQAGGTEQTIIEAQPLVEKSNRPGSGAGVNTKVGPTAKVGSSPKGGGVGVGVSQAKRRQISKKRISVRNLFIGFQSHRRLSNALLGKALL